MILIMRITYDETNKEYITKLTAPLTRMRIRPMIRTTMLVPVKKMLRKDNHDTNINCNTNLFNKNTF